jgi:hypothetical protein
MSDLIAFPDPPDQADQQATRELEHRLRMLHEFAAAVGSRASIHRVLADRHSGFWLGDWEQQKATRFLALAAILASPEFVGFVRGHVGLRELFSRDPVPPLPKRKRVPNHRRSRAKHVDTGLAGWPAFEWPKSW